MLTIQLRRDVSRKWRDVNPVLANGEPGYENDTGKFKIGDGSKRWLDLDYFIATGQLSVEEVRQLVLDHISSQKPHAVYDDGPSLLLLYQNAKV